MFKKKKKPEPPKPEPVGLKSFSKNELIIGGVLLGHVMLSSAREVMRSRQRKKDKEETKRQLDDIKVELNGKAEANRRHVLMLDENFEILKSDVADLKKSKADDPMFSFARAMERRRNSEPAQQPAPSPDQSQVQRALNDALRAGGQEQIDPAQYAYTDATSVTAQNIVDALRPKMNERNPNMGIFFDPTAWAETHQEDLPQ